MDTTKNKKKKQHDDDDDDEATMKKSHRKTPRDYKTGQQDKFLNNTIFFIHFPNSFVGFFKFRMRTTENTWKKNM